MKRKISVFGLLLPLVMVSGCGGDPGLSFKASFKMAYFDTSFETVEMEYKFNIRDYLKTDETPVKEKAKTGLLFFNNIFDGVVIEKGIKTNDNDIATLYSKFELNDFEKINVPANNGVDVNDISLLHCAHKKVDNVDIGFITVQESGGGVQWASNFDVGADNTQYSELTGEHPEWLDHKNHKGFDIAANRAVSKIKDYISRKMDENSQQILYIYGLSRGGAVGNLIAKKLIDDGKKVNAYLYSVPAPTTDENYNDAKYKTIFNYVNGGDFIAQIPIKEWGFTRYGTTIDFNLLDYSEELKEYCNITYTPFPVAKILNAFKKISDTRENLYVISDKLLIAESNSLKESEVEDFVKQYTDLMSGEFEVLNKTVNIARTKNDDNTYSVKITAAPSLLTSLIGVSLTHMDGNMDNIKDKLMSLLPLLQPFLDVGKISMLDLATIGTSLSSLVCNHTFPAFVAYFFKKNK